MIKIALILTILLTTGRQTFGQQLGLAFQDAEKQGISVERLDSMYQNAVHGDSSQAVFKTEIEQQAMGEAFIKLLQDFGIFLSIHNFKWDKPTRCFNRVYFNPNGTIGYFIFNFTGNTENRPSDEQQKEFQRLLNLFTKDYKISMSAKTKFAYCSSTVYMPKNEKESEGQTTN